ncbi:MAG: hypothetical protein ACK5NK_05925 [Niabella sp.]
MKKNILSAIIVLLSVNILFAQKYDEIKNALILKRIDEAKKMFDRNSANNDFFAKPEGFLLKAAIYINLAIDSNKANEADNNRYEATVAFEEYKEMDSDTKLIEENQVYKETPFKLYTAYFNAGVADINNKNYEAAYDKFKTTVVYSDFLISKKIMHAQMDTASIYYTGVLAESTKHLDEAIKYYTRLSDAQIKEYQGTTYESAYQSLMRYYALKNDKQNFDKYRILGRMLYPQSVFFTYKISDFSAIR